uniref:Uncharacterized protein n=1 Tax=Lepeophtheirus salmonis TaxID=72036 RepID=A0A0K2TM28_LEPSM
MALNTLLLMANLEWTLLLTRRLNTELFPDPTRLLSPMVASRLSLILLKETVDSLLMFNSRLLLPLLLILSMFHTRPKKCIVLFI